MPTMYVIQMQCKTTCSERNSKSHFLFYHIVQGYMIRPCNSGFDSLVAQQLQRVRVEGIL